MDLFFCKKLNLKFVTTLTEKSKFTADYFQHIIIKIPKFENGGDKFPLAKTSLKVSFQSIVGILLKFNVINFYDT